MYQYFSLALPSVQFLPTVTQQFWEVQPHHISSVLPSCTSQAALVLLHRLSSCLSILVAPVSLDYGRPGVCRQALIRLLLSGMNISLFSWKYLSSYCLRKVLHSSASVVVVTLRHPVSKSCRTLLVPADGLSAKAAILQPNPYAHKLV